MFQNTYSTTNRVDEKQTLRNLHEKFPDMSLDDLFTILDCIIIESVVNWTPYTYTEGDSTILTAVRGLDQEYDRRFK